MVAAAKWGSYCCVYGLRDTAESRRTRRVLDFLAIYPLLKLLQEILQSRISLGQLLGSDICTAMGAL